MAIEKRTFDFFLKDFLSKLPRDYEMEGTAYALVSGAGASRSAGVPLAGEMVKLLKAIAKLADIELKPPPSDESGLSWFFRTVLEKVPLDSEFADPEREFIAGCIARASREPNLTHILVAHLAVAQIIGPIITTNFDDLALASFWYSPNLTSWVEPHVIYDPFSFAGRPLKVAARVPVIIKAHGHHTMYGLGIIDEEIKKLAPQVKELFKSLPPPAEGFLVVGYSGTCDDGIMALLRDRHLTKGKMIYWFYRGGTHPDNALVQAIARGATIRFVQIVDSDVLFLKLVGALHSDEKRYDPPVLDPLHLVSVPPGWRWQDSRKDLVAREWWPNTPSIPGTFQKEREYPPLVKLRNELLPLLMRLEKWDDDCLLFDCAPLSLKRKIENQVYPVSVEWKAPDEMRQLMEAVPLPIPWGRRNRRILQLALTRHLDPKMPFNLLMGLRQWSR